MGPRKKLNNAIARWHSNARPASGDLEQAYADRMEAEMQEMAIQLHRVSTSFIVHLDFLYFTILAECTDRSRVATFLHVFQNTEYA